MQLGHSRTRPSHTQFPTTIVSSNHMLFHPTPTMINQSRMQGATRGVSSADGYNRTDYAHSPHLNVSASRHHNGAEQQSFTCSFTQKEGDYSPPLIPRRSVPLPELSPNTIMINPLLGFGRIHPPIRFDILRSSSAATLLPSSSGLCTSSMTDGDRCQWRQQPAMYPATIGSMTLRFAPDDSRNPIWRPIVVFPSSPFDSVVTIDDVLKAVSRAVRVAVRERQGTGHEFDGDGPWTTKCTFPQHGVPTTLFDPPFNNCALWWIGLYPSTTERDVWILQTRRTSRHTHKSFSPC